MGRPPLSIEDRIARGNPSKDKINTEMLAKVEKLYELPPAPVHLGTYGKKEWDRTGPKLVEMRLLAETDLPAFEAYCMNIDLMIESKIAINNEGMLIMGARGWVRNPAIAAFGQASTAIRGFVSEFGLSPSARSRIKLPSEDTDILGTLMGDESDEDF
jgi:P27 family predicted phage terminase small subunit